jgi:glycosyl hydrolase group 75 (putative chitosanase)
VLNSADVGNSQMKTSAGFLLVVILLANVPVTSGRGSPTICSKVKLFRAHGVDLWYTPTPSLAIYYKAGLAIDADGAFRAYHPSDHLGLDSLANAGHPGNWWALVTDNEEKNGRPVVQGDSDPAPGYYVSTTALFDRDNPNVRDPHRYVDAATIPYVVLHPRALKFAELGDFAIAVNIQNGKLSGAIVADESAPNLPVGEGSIALANALGINSNPRNGGKRGDVAYVIFEHSGNRKPRGLQEIEANSKRVFEAWGGLDRLNSCLRIE